MRNKLGDGMRTPLLALSVLAFASSANAQQQPTPPAPASAEAPLPVAPISAEQQRTIARLQAAALESDLAWEIVEDLVTEIGPRLAGSEAEARARDWAVTMLREQRFSNVRIEPFTGSGDGGGRQRRGHGRCHREEILTRARAARIPAMRDG